MLVEHRCYVLHADASTADYLKVFKEEALELQGRVLGGLVGYYTTEVGELNAIVSIWEYDTFEERQRRRAALAAEPVWQEYLKKVRPMIKTMRNTLMVKVV